MNARVKAIVALILLMAAVSIGRLVLLHTSEYVYDEEEYKTGSIAYLLMHDRQLPLLEYQPGDYEGGTFLFGVLMIPYFLAFGPNYLALKLLALTTTLLTALAAAWFAKRHAGWPAAWATGALFTLPAPYVFQIGLLPWGNYAENAMLTVITMLLASVVLNDRHRGVWLFGLLGLLLGLGVWMHYGFLVTVLLVIGLWWLIDYRSIFGRRGLTLIVGGLVGFSPWIVYNVTHRWWGLGRFTDAFGKSQGLGGRLLGSLRRFASLWLEDLPAGLHFRASSLEATKLISYAYYLALVFLAIWLVVLTWSRLRQMTVALWPKARRAAADADFWLLAPVLYVVLYALVYGYSDYGLFAAEWGTMDPESHCHIFALYPPLMLIGGLVVGRVWRTRWRVVAVASVALLLLLGGVGFTQMLTPDRPQRARLSRAAYDRAVIYMEIGSKWGVEPEQVERIQKQLTGQALRSFVFGAGIKFGLDHARSLPIALEACAAQPDELLPYCWFGVGTGLYAGDTLPPEQLDAVMASAPANVQPWLVLGSCVGNIWAGRSDYHTCAEAAQINVAALAPPSEAETLRVFVWGHLVMGQFRPVKE